MKELELMALKNLIKLYEDFIKGIKISKEAERLYNEYTPGSDLLSKEVNRAVAPLLEFSINSGLKPLTKEEAKQILEKLKKLQKELEK